MAKFIGIKAILNEFKQRILLLAHPVHSLYMSTDPTNPETLFGGKWESLPAGCFVRNAGGDAGTVGQTQTEGLPNITGQVPLREGSSAYADGTRFGAFTLNYYEADVSQAEIRNHNAGIRSFDLDAHNSNAIYGSSAHVTPYNVAVYMWWRTR